MPDKSENMREKYRVKHERKRGRGNIANINFTLKHVQPLTLNQKITFKEYLAGNNMMLHGLPGTGKSFLLLYLSLNEIMNSNSVYKKLVIIRSVVPTRDVGFLPGNSREKTRVYEAPYYAIFSELFERSDAYEYLKLRGVVDFMTTSFIRGITLNDCIVLVDEMQNASLHELDSCITRIGQNCKVLFSGDFRQSDFTRFHDKEGVIQFMKIIRSMQGKGFSFIEFTRDDIVRSDLVKNYIIAKDALQINC
jgi:phosphate starvation-inducible protein PhoH and related proteins